MSDNYRALSGTHAFELRVETRWEDDETQVRGYQLVSAPVELPAEDLEDLELFDGALEEYLASEYLQAQWEFTPDEVLAVALFCRQEARVTADDRARVRPHLEYFLRAWEGRAQRELDWARQALRAHDLPPRLPPVNVEHGPA